MCLEPAGSPRLAVLARLAAERPAPGPTPSHRASRSMSALPSAPLARDIARCADCRARVSAGGTSSLCVRHEALWRFEQAVAASPEPMAGDVGPLIQEVLSTGDRGSDLLDAFRRQASALNLVWEAHQRGAARLPDEVADTVRAAREGGPHFLAGSPVSRTA